MPNFNRKAKFIYRLEFNCSMSRLKVALKIVGAKFKTLKGVIYREQLEQNKYI